MAEPRESEVPPGTISLEPGSADILLRAPVPPHGLGALMLQIAERRLTGQLSLQSDMGRRTIFFHSGFPVFGESSLFGERLGALGVRHGLLKRDDVARGLALAREHGCGLGQALLELDRVDTPGLFALLAVQLREVVAASCGAEPLRARFLYGQAALRNALVLRLHPLTAVMTALSAVPSNDQRALLATLAERRLAALPVPELARRWLADLGYLGELERLCAGEPTLATLRARLVARQRTGIERSFDPKEVRFALPGVREGVTPPTTPQAIADMVTMTLLLSGALRLGTHAAPTNGSRDSTPPIQLALAEAIDQPPFEIRASEARARRSDADAAIESYLWSEQDHNLAPEAAIWGPSVEAGDPHVPLPVMTLYVTLKPEKRAVIVLDVDSTASPEWISEQYARRLELLGSVEAGEASPHLLCRVAELAQCFDDALEKLLPGSVSQPLSSPPPPPPRASDRPASDASAKNGQTAPSIPPAPLVPRATIPPPPELDTSAAVEALAGKIEGLMRGGNWVAVRDLLSARDPNTLPFVLRLASAMAQRELEAQARAEEAANPRISPYVLAAGIVLGGLLAWLLHVFWR